MDHIPFSQAVAVDIQLVNPLDDVVVFEAGCGLRTGWLRV